MSAKHSDPEYRANARLVRQQVAHARRFGGEVVCQRCRRPIDEQQAFDVGHIDADGGHGRDNLGPEHRYRADCVARGNRSHGGRLGAAITNAKRERTYRPRPAPRRLSWFAAAGAGLFLWARSHPRLRLQQRPLPLNPEIS